MLVETHLMEGAEMARSPITGGSWTSILTTSVDTLVSAEGGPVRLQSGSTSGVDLDDGYYLENGDAVIFPPGLDVSANPVHRDAIVQTIDFGT